MERKPWSEMTDKEILQIRRKQCCRCAYSTSSTINIQGMTCDYIGVTGHRRPCRPEECVEKGIFQLREGKRRKKQLTPSAKPKAQARKPAQNLKGGDQRKAKQEIPARQQDTDNTLESLISEIMERFGWTREKAYSYLRRWVKEQEEKRNAERGDVI